MKYISFYRHRRMVEKKSADQQAFAIRKVDGFFLECTIRLPNLRTIFVHLGWGRDAKAMQVPLEGQWPSEAGWMSSRWWCWGLTVTHVWKKATT